jgi:hypothetical protein
MIKLTDAQQAMLLTAAGREDGAASIPAKTSRAGATKIAASLIARKLMREMKAKAGAPAWRTDENGRSFSLIITRSGRKAVEESDSSGGDDRIGKLQGASERDRRDGDTPDANSPRAGTKQSLLVRMLSSEQGATLDALVDATGWLPHTTRAALTGLRKKGYGIERFRMGGEGASAYRIVAADKAAA